MKITLHLFASLAEYLPDQTQGNPNHLKVEAGTTVKGLIDLLHIPPDAPRIIFRNGLKVLADETLAEGDRIGMFPPLAGG